MLDDKVAIVTLVLLGRFRDWVTAHLDRLFQHQIIKCIGESGKSHPLIFELNPSGNAVIFLSAEPQILENLKVEPSQYLFPLPASGTRYAVRARVNRYTGIMKFEIGNKPFGEGNTDNSLRILGGKKTRNLRLF